MRWRIASSHVDPADRLDHLSGDDVEQVVVGIAAAKTRGRLDEAQLVDDVRATQSGRRIEHQVAGAEPEPAAMDEQIANRHLAARVRVVHLEAGQDVRRPSCPRSSLPSSTSVASSALVNALVVEPIGKSVCASTFAASPMRRTP